MAPEKGAPTAPSATSTTTDAAVNMAKSFAPASGSTIASTRTRRCRRPCAANIATVSTAVMRHQLPCDQVQAAADRRAGGPRRSSSRAGHDSDSATIR